jgi:hypothetical protein
VLLTPFPYAGGWAANASGLAATLALPVIVALAVNFEPLAICAVILISWAADIFSTASPIRAALTRRILRVRRP